MNKLFDNSPVSNFAFIIALVVAFNVFWPLGIFLLLKKIGIFDKKTTKKNINSNSRQNARMEKYKIMTEGRSVESISYLASALGVSYDTALRDLQQMVADGQFGPGAYINYVDKTVVLVPGEKPRDDAGAKAKTSSNKKSKSSSKKKKKQEAARDEAPYDTLRTVLLIAGVALLGAGIWRLADPIDWLIWLGFDTYTIREMIPGALMVGGGLFSLIYRGVLKKRSARFKVYSACCTGQDYVMISELAAKTGVSVKKATRDIEAMLDKELLGANAYIDQSNGALILKPGAGPKAEPEPEPPRDDEDRYRAILREIRELNDAIPDPEVSRRIDEMEDLTSKIFHAVEEKPEKLPQIKSFMSYYLPTTLKLLRSYADFEGSGAQGENITNAKAEIERILDTLVDGFRKQLDKLYEADAMDISSDIDVLETMLRRDGLSGDDSGFKAASRGK